MRKILLLSCVLLTSCNAFWFDGVGNPTAIVTGNVGSSTDFQRQGRVGLGSALDGTTSNNHAIDHSPAPGRIVMRGANGAILLIEGLENPIMSKLPDTIVDITKIGATGRSIDNIVNKASAATIEGIKTIE